MAAGVKFEPTVEQLQWLADKYPCTKNAELCAALEISQSVLSRLARKLWLNKSPEFMHQCQVDSARAAHANALATDRYRRMSEEMKGHLPAHLEAHKFRPGNKPKCTPEAYAKGAMKRNEIIKAERRRVLFGLPQRTRLHVTGQSRSKINYRYRMRRLGYVELPGEKNVLRYPAEDMRRSIAERGASRYGIKILPLDCGGQ